MASIANVVAGLEILAKTARVPAGLAAAGVTDRRQAHVETDHDIIFLPSADPSPEDQKELEKLGWFLSEEFDCWAMFT